MCGENVKETTISGKIFVRKAFRSFFMPSLLSCMGLAVGGLADCVFVGNVVGMTGLTALNISQPVYMLFNTISYSLSIGGSIRYSAALGDGKTEEGNRIFANVLGIALGLYLTLCALGLLFLPQVLTFLGAGEPGTEVWTNCESVVRAQLLLVPLMFCQGPFYYFINSDNNPKLAGAALLTSNTLDIIFNYIFVVLLRLGPAGSVYSTGVGAAVMICISLTHILGKKGCLRFTAASWDWCGVAKSFRMGFATSVQYVYQFATILVCNHLLMHIAGNLGVAVFGIVFNVALLASSAYDAVSMALQPMVSTFNGERNNENIRDLLREAFWVTMAISCFLMMMLLLFPEQVCLAFGLRGFSELTAGADAVRIYAAGIVFSGINMLMTYYYQALEKESMSFLLFTLRNFVFFLAFSLLLGWMGLDAFWWIYPATEISTLLVMIFYNQKKHSWTYLKPDDGNVYRAFLYSGTADLGRVEREVDAYMEQRGASVKQTYFVSMMVEEVCGVILSKAFYTKDGYLQLTIVPQNDGDMTLHLRDNAKKFNPFALNTDGISLEQETGLDAIGIKVIKSRAKDFFYRRYAGFNTLVVRI
ncbi:MatE efflux family protein [Oscillibacter valericigenes Sjm18-20]|nr:MatE efflux family protein [Oscillibacter valericigenes Sjm18-20]